MVDLQDFKPGDLLGFSHRGCVGYGINLASRGFPGWGLSHVAMISLHPEDKTPILYESTMSAPGKCLLQKKKIAGVQCRKILSRIREYPGRVWQYPIIQPFGFIDSQLLTEWWVSRLGTAYDATGAIHCRDKSWWMRDEDLSSLFCSEAVVAAWREVNVVLVGKKSASGWSPNAVGRAVLKQGVCGYPRRLK